MTFLRNRRKLKNFLINPRFQLKYILLIGLSGIGLAVAYSVIFYRFMSENYAILVELSPMTDEAKGQLYAELHRVVTYLGIFSAIFILLVCFVGLVVSHRAAGPLYHFRKIFQALESGDNDARVRLRPQDDFQDVAESFNRMIDRVQGKSGK